METSHSGRVGIQHACLVNGSGGFLFRTYRSVSAAYLHFSRGVRFDSPID